MQSQLRSRLFSSIVILSMLLTALGLPGQAVRAAPAGTAVQFDGSNDHVTFGNTRMTPGTLAGTPAWNSAANSRLGDSSLTFNGTSQYVTTGTGTTFNSAAFTVETWFYRTGAGTGVTTGNGGITSAIPLLTKGTSEDETPGVDINYFLGIDASSARLVADFEEAAGGAAPSQNHPVTGITAIVNNTWYHAAATYDGSKWQLFLNGNLEAELIVNQPANAAGVSPLALATSIRSNGTTIQGYFAGRLDEARVWNYARTQAEIQGTLTSEILIPTDGLIGRWGLNDGSSTTASNLNRLGVTAFTLETWVKRGAGGATMSTGTNGFDNLAGRPLIYPVLTRGMGEGEAPANINTNYFLGITADGFVGADFEDAATGGNHPAWGTTPVPVGEWHHIAAAYTGSCWSIYVDGILDTLNTLSVECPNATPESTSYQHPALAAGLNSSGGLGAGYFSGVIDEARVWNRALSQTELSDNKSLELSSGTGLLARWGLNEGTGTTTSSSAGVFPGTLVNGPAWTAGFPIPDSDPPAPPTGLSAVGGAAIVTLTWAANAEPDLAGYNLYRSTTTGGPYTKANTALITTTSHLDSGLINGTPYYYVLRAVDTSNNESENSGEVTATPSEAATGLSFDGVDDYVTFGVAPGLGVTNFTLETWFYWTGGGASTTTSSTQGLPSVIPLISKGRGEGDGSTVDMNYFLGIDTATKALAVDFEDTASGMNYPFVGTTPVTINTWHHAAATYDSATAVYTLYLDGVPAGSMDLGSNILPRSDSIQHAGLASAMTSAGAPAGYFQGVIDEARIWNVARTQAEIRSTANAQVSSGAGLVARWGMGEGSGATIASSVGSFNGTLTNGPTFAAEAPFDLVFDSIPPAAPANLMSSPRPGAVQLEWSVNTEADLAGYRVYRGTTSPVIKGTPINGIQIPPSFLDTGVTAGLTYYYAVTAVDSSGNESPLSNEVSAVPLPPPPAEALDFGSNSAYVTFGDPAALDLPQFTVETWFKRNGAGISSTTGGSGIANAIPLVTHGAPQVDNSDNRDANWMLVIDDTTDVIAADFEDMATGANHPAYGVTPITDDAWHHAAMTYDGATWKLYLDGNLERTLTINATPRHDTIQHAALGTMIESDGTSTNGFFNGTLDEVRVWNYVRTQAQIAGTINTRLSDPQAGLVARWGLDEASGTAINDSTGNVPAGAITGSGYSWVPGSPFNAEVNLAPEAPVLAGPAHGAVDVSVPAGLAVTVTDPEGQPLDVTFYGRPLQSAAGPDFTFIAVPDPQYYAASYPSIYNAQMSWIVDNKTSNNIVFAASLGDNVDVASNTAQWDNAVAAWDILDSGGVPYGLAAGNHDGAPSSTANFNSYFGVSRFSGKPWYGGHYGTDNDNHYALFSASGLNFIVIFIEYDSTMTSTGHPVLAWANGLLQTHSSRRAIVVSHNLLSGNSFSTQGQTIYNALKANPNLFLMLGGHLDVAGQRTDTDSGHTIYTLRSDYQTVDNQQSGYLRVMRFSPADDMIYVRTYSPTQDKDYDKADAAQNNFNLPYVMDGTGFSVIGTVADAPSGSTASIQWDGLNPEEQYEWFVIASDGTHQTPGDTWSFTTAGIVTNTPPEAVADAYIVDEDSPLSIAAPGLLANDTDAESDPLTAIKVTDPAAGSVAVNADGSFTYTPQPDFHGVDSFTYKASDGALESSPATVTITVSAVNDAPLAAAQSVTTDEDTPLAVTLTGSDVDGDPLTYAVVDQPQHGALSGAAPNLSYTPTADYNGADSFTFKANDGTADSALATVSITVNAVNDPPTAGDDAYATAEDTLLEVPAPGLLENDDDIDGDPLTSVLVTSPSHGTLTLHPDGSFSYLPEGFFNGADSFTYKANDNLADSNTATVTINVSSVNNAPSCSDVTIDTEEDVTGQADPDCTDPDGSVFTVSIVDAPAHGTAQVVDGKLVYSPAANYSGSDSFTYRASDGLESNAAAVTVNVAAVNDAPVADPQNLSTDQNTPKAITLTGSDVEGSPLTFSVVDAPLHGALSGAAPELVYTPAANYSGPDSFTFKANDSELDSAPATVSILVNEISVPPLPSSFYGQIHISDNPPSAGSLLEAYVPGMSGPAASAAVQLDAGQLVYAIDVPGDQAGGIKDGGLEGDLITFKIGSRVVATGVWHSGTNIELHIHPPEALSGGPYSADEGSAIAFSGSANDWGTDASTYQWDWEDDGTYDETAQNPAHTFAQDGSYTVRLRVMDGQGGEGTQTVNVTVTNVAPTVDAGGPYSGTDKSAVVFSGMASDPGADSLTYEWDFDYDGTTFDVDASGYLDPSHLYTLAGEYTAALRVSDDDTSVIDMAEVSVTPGNVVPQITGQAPLSTGEDTPLTITLNDLVVTDPDNTYPDDFMLTVEAGSNYSLVGHTITPAPNFHGNLTVPVHVNDGSDDSNTFNLTVAVVDLLPTNVDAGGPYTGTAGQPLGLSGSTTCPSVDTCSFAWDLDNDGQYEDAAIAAPTYTWNTAGAHTVGLRVTDGDGNAVTDTASVQINPAVHSIALVPGWNLVSFNLHPLDTSPASVLSSIAGNYNLVYAWDASGAHSSSGNWVKYNPVAPPYQNSLFNLDETMGFWIYMTAADTLEVAGNVPSTSSIQLWDNASGWNLVGYPALGNGTLPSALSDHGVGTDFSLIYAYHAADTADVWKLFNRTALPYVNDLTALTPGWGYWIKVNADHSWTVEYSLP